MVSSCGLHDVEAMLTLGASAPLVLQTGSGERDRRGLEVRCLRLRRRLEPCLVSLCTDSCLELCGREAYLESCLQVCLESCVEV